MAGEGTAKSTKKAEPKITLRLKLYNIMCDVERIAKDKVNKEGGNYQYASEKIIKEVFHAQLVKHRVLFCLDTSNPRTIDIKNKAGEGKVTVIDCKYAFLDVDSDEEIGGTFVGSGNGRDDKGVYAAVTGCIKYVLTSNFLIPTGDDPEAMDEPAKNGKPTVNKMSMNDAPAPAKTAPPAEPAKKQAATLAMEDAKGAAAEVSTAKTQTGNTVRKHNLGIPTGDPIAADDVPKIIDAFSKLPDAVTEEELVKISGLPVVEWTQNIKSTALDCYNHLYTGAEKKMQMFEGML